MAWRDDPYGTQPRRLSLFGGDPTQTPGVGMTQDWTANPAAYAPGSFTTDRGPDQYGQPAPAQQASRPLMAADPYGQPGPNWSTLAGLAANAISPYSWGGRLGGLMANHNMQQDQWNRYGQMRQAGLRAQQDRPFATNPNQTMWAKDENGQWKQVGYSGGAQPATAMGSRREGYVTPDGIYHPPVEGGWSPRQSVVPLNPAQTGFMPGAENQYTAPLLPSQSAPPATPLGSSRPAYGDYPAVEGQWSPRQSMVPVAPGSSPYDIEADSYGPQAPLLPSQAAPPATPRTASRPAYTNQNTGEAYPAVGPLFSPREQAVVASPGSTVIPGPGQPRITVPQTYQQSTRSVSPGGSVVQGGKVVATAPQTGAQQAKSATGGPAGGKPAKPTQFDKQVEGWVNEFNSYQPTEDTTWLGGYAGTPSKSPQQQAQEKIKQMAITDPTSARIMQHAYFQVFGGGKGGVMPTQPQGKTGGTHRLSGQQTERADGTYRLPDGSTVTVVNGVIR